jgi:hypothetical protein
MEKTLLEKIKEDIEKTGFITELQAGDILYQNGWRVSHSESYEDLDSFKSREIDIVATRSFDDKKTNLHIEFHLIIESKKLSKYPWVIFSTPHIYRGWGWRTLHSGWNYTTKKTSIFRHEVLKKKNPFNDKARFGKAFYEAFKKQNSDENSKIFDAILSVCKAAYHKKCDCGDTEPFKNGFNKNEAVELHFFIPVIILAGTLVEAYLDNGEIVLKEEDWIPLEYSISSNKFEKSKFSFFPTIVTFAYFQDYIELINKWVDSSNETFREDLKKIKQPIG